MDDLKRLRALAYATSDLSKDFEQHHGRVDLRGIAIVQPQTRPHASIAATKLTNVPELKGATFASVDFSDAILDNLRLIRCSIVDCLFEGTSAARTGWWESRVEKSEFRKARLNEAILGGAPVSTLARCIRGLRRDATWRSVLFTNCDLRSITVAGAVFEDCTFDECEIEHVHFEGCVFRDVRFNGLLRDVMFSDGRHLRWKTSSADGLRRVDFGSARFDDVSFVGLNLDEVDLPRDSEFVAVQNYRRALRRAIDSLKEDDSEHGVWLRALFLAALSSAGPNQEIGGFSFGDLHWDPHRRDAVMYAVELLRRSGG